MTDSSMEDALECSAYMSKLLSLIKDMKKLGIDPAIAANESNLFMQNFFMYSASNRCHNHNMDFTPDD